jgi:hypothetical protein
MGNHYVQKSKSATQAHASKGMASPQLLLDYRCHLGEEVSSMCMHIFCVYIFPQIMKSIQKYSI